jgi:hypothetical protein
MYICMCVCACIYIYIYIYIHCVCVCVCVCVQELESDAAFASGGVPDDSAGAYVRRKFEESCQQSFHPREMLMRVLNSKLRMARACVYSGQHRRGAARFTQREAAEYLQRYARASSSACSGQRLLPGGVYHSVATAPRSVKGKKKSASLRVSST